jgi:hypothetical protein
MGKVAVKYARPIYVFLLSSSFVVQLSSYTVIALKLIAVSSLRGQNERQNGLL